MEADFSGYATKAGLKCSDGRTIMPEAFVHMDGMTVPLVWQHGHNDPTNVLGHAVLEAREDGVYAQGFFNETPQAETARALVQHEDIRSLSIYANQLVEKSKQVFHGVIREVSLVLSGANPGALIDFVAIKHSDGEVEELADEAVIYTGLELEHADGSGDPTIQDVYDSLTDEQKNVVHYMIGVALESNGSVSQSADGGDTITHTTEGSEVSRTNVFEQNGGTDGSAAESQALTHDAMKGIVADAQKRGSLKEAVEAYALQHGIDNIEVLFPEARNIDQTPEWISRRMEWVTGVLGGARKSPFSRIRTRNADITMEEARARGYIKGNLKKEEFFSVSSRITTPTTVYKKQKLDRDDIIDITDMDVVAWLKAEMRVMLEEELARAILIGDGRDVSDEDKIRDPAGSTEGAGIRAIVNDHDLYVTHINVNISDADSDYNEIVEQIMRSRHNYKGTGTPTFYTTNAVLVEMLLSKDSFGRRRWESKAALANSLMVSDIVEVEVMESETDLLGIIVNLSDYVIGADRGGEINTFDDFDIDYNQYKYLIETRVCGALVKLKSALVIHKTAANAVAVIPPIPAFNKATGVITIPTSANADYTADGVAKTDGATVTVPVGESVIVEAVPASGKFFADDGDTRWTYTRRA